MVRLDIPSGRLLQVERLNQEPILVEIVRPSIWQPRGSPGTRGLNMSHVSSSPLPDERLREGVTIFAGD